MVRKEVAVQVDFGDGIPPHVSSKTPLPEMEYPQFLYRSHRIFLLALVCLGIIYLGLFYDDSNPDRNYRLGLVTMFLTLVFVCGIHIADSGYMSRPHPAFWRMLQGISLTYFAILFFLLMQNTDDIRRFLNWVDPALGKPLPEKDYATDCRIYTPENPNSMFANLKGCVFDCFMLAHLIGWWMKMIIVRDVKLCWFLSILFEFMEISLKHQLPNFAECWWDSWILDVIVCNGGGIYLGYLTCRFCDMKEYHWGMGKDHRNESHTFSSLSRPALQLTPYSWVNYKWEMFSSTKNFISVLWYIIFVNLVDLSNFYLKFILYMPSDHWTLFIRVWYWAIMAIVSTREFYEFTKGGFTGKLGSQCWLSHAILCAEWMITYKNAGGMFNETMPFWLQIAWSGIGAFCLTSILVLFHRDLSKQR